MQLFQKSNDLCANVINLVPASITMDDNAMFNASFTREEFKHAPFSMQANKCPGREDLIWVFTNIFGILVVMKYIKRVQMVSKQCFPDSCQIY